MPEVAVAVEVGVLAGTLSRYLLSQRPGLHLVMVDSWAPADAHSDEYKGTGDYHALQNEYRAARARQSAERKIKPYRKRVTILPLESGAAATRIRDASCDMVFLDGDHSEVGVARDLLLWAPKVKRGGYIGGHDYENPNPRFTFGVKKAVDLYAAVCSLELEIDDDGTWFCRL